MAEAVGSLSAQQGVEGAGAKRAGVSGEEEVRARCEGSDLVGAPVQHALQGVGHQRSVPTRLALRCGAESASLSSFPRLARAQVPKLGIFRLLDVHSLFVAMQLAGQADDRVPPPDGNDASSDHPLEVDQRRPRAGVRLSSAGSAAPRCPLHVDGACKAVAPSMPDHPRTWLGSLLPSFVLASVASRQSARQSPC